MITDRNGWLIAENTSTTMLRCPDYYCSVRPSVPESCLVTSLSAFCVSMAVASGPC